MSCYDARTRNPRWVAEALTAEGSRGGEGSANRTGVPFSEDGALPRRFRASLDDFRASGFDRGHLAAAANHRGAGPEALRATFTLSNVSPQARPAARRAPRRAGSRAARRLAWASTATSGRGWRSSRAT